MEFCRKDIVATLVYQQSSTLHDLVKSPLMKEPTNMYFDIEVVEYCDTVMEKSWKRDGILSQRYRGNPGIPTVINSPRFS